MFSTTKKILRPGLPRCLSSIKKSWSWRKTMLKIPHKLGFRSLFFLETPIFGSCFLWQLDEHSCFYRFRNMRRVLHINKTWLLKVTKCKARYLTDVDNKTACTCHFRESICTYSIFLLLYRFLILKMDSPYKNAHVCLIILMYASIIVQIRV